MNTNLASLCARVRDSPFKHFGITPLANYKPVRLSKSGVVCLLKYGDVSTPALMAQNLLANTVAKAEPQTGIFPNKN
jgi:hypothetical protein